MQVLKNILVQCKCLSITKRWLEISCKYFWKGDDSTSHSKKQICGFFILTPFARKKTIITWESYFYISECVY